MKEVVLNQINSTKTKTKKAGGEIMQVYEMMLERIKAQYEMKLSKKKKERWRFIIEYLDKIPTFEARYVQRTGNDYFGRSYEKGVRIFYEKDNKKIEFEANLNIWHEEVFPHAHINTKTNKTFREQLIELIATEKINLDTTIYFEYYDFEDKTYDYSWTYTFKVKDIMLYLNVK